jgi:hypothetical protein
VPLIVEDGTGKPDAESYCTVDYADSYFIDRGIAGWDDLPPSIKEQSLRKATDYMATYSTRWTGYRVSSTQALDWPRIDARNDAIGYRGTNAYFSSNEIPSEVRKACAELAFRSSTSTLAPDAGQTVIREKVGPIETEYAQGSSSATRFRFVDNLLQRLLTGDGSTLTVVRS